jgi:glycosyltransferase involved in cell wall biosynthesis
VFKAIMHDVKQTNHAYKIGFILEQALGHITHSQNLQRNVPGDPSIEPYWGLLPFEATGLAARLPVYKSNWTVRSGLRARRAVARLTRRAPLDALFFHTQVPAVLAQHWIRLIPSIVSLDATPLQVDTLGAAYDHSRDATWIEQRKWVLSRDCFCAARRLVTWSDWTKQSLVADYEVPAEKVTVIPPGVNPAEWSRPAAAGERNGNEPVKLLFVGGNLRRKGGDDLLEAFRSLRELNVELHLATKDRVPSTPGVVVYNDMQPNSAALKALYHSADIFCLPTKGDCLPMVLSEAGAAGLPVVTTKLAAIPEIVRDGESGYVVPPGDVAALVAALRRLVEDAPLRARLGRRAVEIVARDYDAQRNARRLLALIKQTVDEARAGR